MIQAAVLTILIETLLFILFGYRQKRFLAVVALANLLTNVTLNLAVFLTALLCVREGWPVFAVYAVIGIGEVGAVAVEYIIYKSYFERGVQGMLPETIGNTKTNPGQSSVTSSNRILFFQTLATNVVSFLTGLFIVFIWG